MIIIGDSSVYGWGDSEAGGWSTRLSRHWINSGKNAVIYSLGIRGDGLEDVAQRWYREWRCRGELRRNFPEGLLLSVGLNDTARIGREDGRPQLSVDAFRFGFERLLKQMKKEAQVMVIGLTPVNENKMPFAKCLWYSNKSCSLYESLIEESCLELDVPFLATYKNMRDELLWKEWITADGIHLNSEGHKWLFKRLREWAPLTTWVDL
ncbi:hypothetical protein EV10_1416 [Prochlorococcus marinus str. SS51]|nr:hypothetical protein EV09_1087 [Prochlorococcus marinus str. SS35]KGG32301.1 hypothetical protein EV10_1416 [Prochlorococcus marinus str. SS51]